MSKLSILFIIIVFVGCISQPSEPSYLPESLQPPSSSPSPSPFSSAPPPPQPSSPPLPQPEPNPYRTVISLDGEWELLRVREDTLTYSQTKTSRWEKVRVPHYLSAWELHRAWYRRRFKGVEAPHVSLTFDSVNFKCVVYLNNQYLGEHTGGYLSFEFDITNHLKSENELIIGVEDVTALLKKGSTLDLLEDTPDCLVHPVGSAFHVFGVWQSVSLVTRPAVYIKDVYVKPSYRKKIIVLDITVCNEDKTPVTFRIENTIGSITFPGKEVHLSPSETQTITISHEWENPLMWSPEFPYLYYVRTSLVTTTSFDMTQTRFGFREFWVEGGEFYLNGVRIHLRGSSKHLLGDPWTGNHEKDAKETLIRVKQVNSNALRLHANPYPHAFLDAADEMGVLIIDESALWCLSDQYDLASDAFWENARAHITQLVLRDRNHPSLVIWSAENEILLCGGEHEKRTREELIELGDLIKTLDYRPLMYEGDFDLPNADIVNLHYPHEYPEWNVFPNEAYFLDSPFVPDTYPHTEMTWDRKKPLYIGEFLWIPPFSPYPHTIFYGDEVFTDFELYRNKAKASAWKMYVEAFRSQGVNGFCPWNVLEGGEYPTPLSETLKEVYTPLFAFTREYNTNFFTGERVKRTVVVCNDTSERRDVEITWSAGEESGEFSLALNPAEHTEVEIVFEVPHVEEKKAFEMTIHADYGAGVCELKKVYYAHPEEKLMLSGRIGLYDPVGETRKILDENGITYENLEVLPLNSDYDLLIVGYHALKEDEIPSVGEMSLRGTILLFEQVTLSPFGLALMDHSSTMAFERVPLGVTLSFWGEDHLISRKDIAKPQSGNFIPLADSGGSGGLEYVPLLEYSRGGRIIFCQLLVTEKYDTDPCAREVLQRIFDYMRQERPSRTLGVTGDAALLDFLEADYTKDCTVCDVFLIEGKYNPDHVNSFVQEGGIAWIRNSELMRSLGITLVTLNSGDLPVVLLEDRLTCGLSNQEFYWMGERERWTTPLSLDIARYTLSGDGIPLTSPCVFLKVPYGKGYFLLDTLQWEHSKASSARIYSILLTNLGISVAEPGLALEAENMRVAEVDIGQRGEGAYHFYTNGYLGAPVQFSDSGVYVFRIYGWADVADGKGAIAEISLDRESKGRVEIREKDVYRMEIFVEKGVHEVGIAFVNDYWEPPEDRNLYVDKITITYKGSRLILLYWAFVGLVCLKLRLHGEAKRFL